MSDGQIVAFGLTKVFGQITAVNNLSFAVRPGRVTAILGPQRSGKTTILRLLLNLDQPTAGCIMIDGFGYADLPDPSATIGAVLGAGSDPPDDLATTESIGAYLRRLCRRRRMPASRASELLELVELNAAEEQTGAGLAAEEWRRLTIAAALVPDPRFLVLDEPNRGLNAVGLRWMQALFGHLTAAGHTIVFVSRTPSHVRLLADDVIEISAGSLVAQGPVEEVLGGRVEPMTLVRTPTPAVLAAALDKAAGRQHATTVVTADGDMYVTGLDAGVVGEVARQSGVALHQLVTCDADHKRSGAAAPARRPTLRA
ncbi:MAG TPA: ATP-binding cassette domain-containing protein [Micromonosporaceae bacterium]|nr:ATP-binding cassette domain-containing protein [Micromonosporaceae bacterium]